MDIIKKYKLFLLGLPKTLLFNFHYFPFKTAIKLPVLLTHRVRLKKMKGKVIIDSHKIRRGMIIIGGEVVPLFDSKTPTIWNVSGEVFFKGNCSIGHGSKIGVGGKLIFGQNFSITSLSTIICENYVEFGTDVLISWNCQIMDCDYHKIIINGKEKTINGKIIIGNSVWIGMNVIILKNSSISNNCVIAAASLINKKFIKEKILIGGAPAHVIKENITWEI